MRVREGECSYAAQAEQRRQAAAAAAARSAPATKSRPASTPPLPPGRGSYDGVLGPSARPAASTPEAAKAHQLQSDIATSPNRDRALAASSDLKKLQAGQPDRADRITPQIRETLLRGVATPRTADARGQEGVLGRRQAREAADTLMKMPRSDYDALTTKLDAAGSETERALILKSVAARSTELTGSDTARSQAMGEVTGFADDIRGTARETLVRTTSPIDIDGANTSRVDPEDPHKKAGHDTRVDNDGLTQRYTNSCAPTAAQIVRGEADPIYAKRLHDEGIDRIDDSSSSAREQQGTLRDAGAKTQSNRKDSDTALSRTADIWGQASEKLDEADRTLVDDHLSGKPVSDTAGLDRALGRCGSSREEIAKLRATAAGGDGMSLKTAADRIAADRTHVAYTEHSVGAEGLGKHLPGLDRKLADGQDVPITIDYGNSTSGHALAITDGRDGKYLVSDPFTGRSAWVPKKELIDGSFSEKYFDMMPGKVDAYYG